MEWSFELYDYNGNFRCELWQLTEKKIYFGLNANSTFTCSTTVMNSQIQEILTPNRIIVGKRRNHYTGYMEQIFVGEIDSLQINKTAGNKVSVIGISASGPWSRLQRAIANNAAGDGYTAAGPTFTDKQKGIVAADLINKRNQYQGNTRVRAAYADQQESALITIETGTWAKKYISDCITDMNESLDGIDWFISPALYSDTYGIVLGDFHSGPALGEDKTNTVIFEDSDGLQNIANINQMIDYSQRVNKVYQFVDDRDPLLVDSGGTGADSIAEIGLLEQISDSDVSQLDLARSITSFAAGILKFPDNKIEFTPAPENTRRVPIFGIDYNVGDRIKVRSYSNKQKIVDITMRVYDATITVSDAGTETVQLGLDPK